MYKHFISLLLLISTIVGQAQELKTLDLESTVFREFRDFYPERLSGVEWISPDAFVNVGEKQELLFRNLKGDTTKTITVAEINKGLNSLKVDSIRSVRPYAWLDSDNFILQCGSYLVRVNSSDISTVLALRIPNGAENLEFSKNSGFLAYTLENNVFVATPSDSAIQVTNHAKGSEISVGVAIHRFEFGIAKGLFWSEDGKTLGFYEMDESMVTDYPLVNYNPVPAEVNLVKYPMAGQKSHHAKTGIFHVETNEVVYLKTGEPLDHFLTNFTFSPNGKRAYLAEVNRDQNHIKLGLFDDPYRYVSKERNQQQMMSADKLALSKQAAIESIVLLKNDQNVLPLQSGKKIAFIGPLVKDKRNLIGSWSGAGDYKQAISLWEALQKRNAANMFSFSLGANLVEDQSLMDKLNPHDGQLTLDAKTPKELIDDAVKLAYESDVVVAVLGEAFGMSGEAASRSNISLLPNQQMLLRALKTTGKPIVLVLMNGRPLTLSWEDENMDAILETWFGGTMAGPAIADMLFGEANPSGKITMTFPRNVGQIPIYYNHKNTGRPLDVNQKYTTKYLDVANTPLYPFGHGLSYTHFTLGDVVLSNSVLRNGQDITASITLTNAGTRKGKETVQLYLRDMVASITRPVKELKGFQQITLNPGETKTVSFTISVDDCKFYNADLQHVYEPGKFKVFIGKSSEVVKEGEFELVE